MAFMWVVYMRATWRTFHPEPKKSLKNPTEKNFLYFQKWNFAAQILKKFFIFSQKKAFLIFSQNKVFPIFLKTEPTFFIPYHKNKRTLPQKIYYSSGNRNPEKNFTFNFLHQSFIPQNFFSFEIFWSEFSSSESE